MGDGNAVFPSKVRKTIPPQVYFAARENAKHVAISRGKAVCDLSGCEVFRVSGAFLGGALIGGIFALRYIAPQIYGPLLTLLRSRVSRLEAAIDDDNPE